MRLIGLAILLAVLSLLGWWLCGQSLAEIWSPENLQAHFAQSRSWAWLIGILLLIADLLLPVPSTIVMSALGAVYGFWLGGLLASAGSMLTGSLGYGIGRFFNEQRAAKWLGPQDFEKGKNLFQTGGAWIVAVSRAIPILPEVISCMAGLLRMPFRKFLLALGCGCIPMGFLFSWIGTIGLESPSWGLAFTLGAPAVLWLLASRFMNHGKSK